MRIWYLSVLFCFVQVAIILPSAEAADNGLQPIPSLTGPVIDLTGTLSADQQEQLSQKLRLFREKYGAQMQVLIIPTTTPEDAFTYSMRVVEQWKLGTEKKDDGLLLFIAKDDRRSQIQVGYGLEGTIPDVVASRLLDQVMAPYFKQGDFFGGINAVIDGVYQRISGEITPTPEGGSNKGFNDNQQGAFIFVVIGLGVIALKLMSSFMGKHLAPIAGAPLIFFIVWLLIGWSLLMAFGMVFIILFLAWLPNDIWFALLASGRHGRSGHGGSWSGGGGGFGGGGAGGRW